MSSSPKFNEATSIKLYDGTIGTILKILGDKPYYSKESESWIYKWSLGTNENNTGEIPEYLIHEYYDASDEKWKIVEKRCGECNKTTTKKYNGAAYCSDRCWNK